MNTQSLLRASLTAGILLTAVGSQAQTYLYQKISASPNVQTFALEVTDDGRIGGWTTDYIHVNGFVDNAGTLPPPRFRPTAKRRSPPSTGAQSTASPTPIAASRSVPLELSAS